MAGLCCYPYIGVVAGLLGSIAINCGNNLQSLGMQELEILMLETATKKGLPAPTEPSDPKNSRVWVFGTVVFVTGSLLNFASYSLAPQSLLASLEAIQFVTNVLFGKFVLGKAITRPMLIGTSLTVCGTILAIAFSSKQGAEIGSVTDLLDLWNNPAWIVYIFIVMGLAVALHMGYRAFEAAEIAGRPYPSSKNAMAVMYSTYSALFGSTSVVFAKLLAYFVELIAEGVNVAEHWFFYVTFFSWLGLMLYWLVRLNNALALYDPLFIIPLLQANFIFFAIISGGIYFQEFNYMTASMWVGFTSGICVIFLGLYFLAPPPNPETSAKEFQMELSDFSTSRRSLSALAEEENGTSKGRTSSGGSQDPSARHWKRSMSTGDGEDVSLDFNATMLSMYSSVRSGLESAASVQGQRKATFLFMTGAAQLNHHENSLRLIKARKEQELMLLVSSKHGLTKEETDKVKTLMSEIKVADNAQEMVATFDHMKKQNGTVSAEEAATFRDQVMAFRNTTILSFAGERRSMSVSERPSVLRSSLSFFGSTRDSTTNELHEHRSSEASDFNQMNPSHVTRVQQDNLRRGSSTMSAAAQQDALRRASSNMSSASDDSAASDESMRNNASIRMSRGSTDSEAGGMRGPLTPTKSALDPTFV